MSTAPKGYPTTQKLDRVTADFATVSPIAQNQNGLDVRASLYVFKVGDDAVDAGSTNAIVKAAGIESVARRGDIIIFTSGALNGYEAVVAATATDSVILGEDLPAVPATLDTFDIMRFVRPLATPGGSFSAAFSFIRNGSSQLVTEDTVNAANNRPLPVKLESTGGEVTINAGDLNVNIEHDGANPSSVRLGDGTNLAAITSNNEVKTLPSPSTGRALAYAPTRLDYSVTPVTTAAYVELIANTTNVINKTQIFDSSGQTMVIALGAVGMETDRFFVFPGGIETDAVIPAGVRVSIKAVSANATTGEFSANFLA